MIILLSAQLKGVICTPTILNKTANRCEQHHHHHHRHKIHARTHAAIHNTIVLSFISSGCWSVLPIYPTNFSPFS